MKKKKSKKKICGRLLVPLLLPDPPPPPGPSLPWRAAALKRNALESKLEVAWGGGIGNADYFATTLVICTCRVECFVSFLLNYIFSFQQILWKSM